MIEEAPGETLEVGRVIKVTLPAVEFHVAVVGQPSRGANKETMVVDLGAHAED